MSTPPITYGKSSNWSLVILLSGGLAMDYLARLAPYSVIPLLRRDLSFSDVSVGLLASVFLWTYGILSPYGGYLGDRFSRRLVLVISIVTWSVASLLCAFVTASWQLVALRAVLAVGEVCYMPTALAMIADFHAADTRARAVGLFQSGSYVGILLGGFPAAYVSARVGWRPMFVGCAGFSLLLAYSIWKRGPERRRLEDHEGHSIDKQVSVRDVVGLVRMPLLLWMMVAFALSSGNFWVLFTYLPLFVYDKYHLSLAAAAFQSTFYMQVATMILAPLFGAMSDTWATRNRRNRFLACALASALGMPALVAIGIGRHYGVLIGGLVVSGLVLAGQDANWMPILCSFVSRDRRATAYGLLNLSGCITGGIWSMVTALIMRAYGLGTVIACLGVLFVLVAIILLVEGYIMLPRYIGQRRQQQESSLSTR